MRRGRRLAKRVSICIYLHIWLRMVNQYAHIYKHVYICTRLHVYIYMASSRFFENDSHRGTITERTLKIHAPGHAADMSAV